MNNSGESRALMMYSLNVFGNDGTIDHTWTFTTAQLNVAAG